MLTSWLERSKEKRGKGAYEMNNIPILKSQDRIYKKYY